jgi:hypothetical protein
MLFLYAKAPAFPVPADRLEPTQTTHTEVTLAGATQEKVPTVVYALCPGGGPKERWF